jgi:probable rRNA maturation factor
MSASGDRASWPTTAAPARGAAAQTGRRPLVVLITIADADWSAFTGAEAAVRDAAAALAQHQRCVRANGMEASIVLAGDALVRGLNRTYRGKDAATNVLSFPFQVPPGAKRDDVCLLGDVILAAETVQREAQEGAIPPLAHLQHLVVHGLLHLLGYDHACAKQAQDMERLESEILATLGVGDPYADLPQRNP